MAVKYKNDVFSGKAYDSVVPHQLTLTDMRLKALAFFIILPSLVTCEEICDEIIIGQSNRKYEESSIPSVNFQRNLEGINKIQFMTRCIKVQIFTHSNVTYNEIAELLNGIRVTKKYLVIKDQSFLADNENEETFETHYVDQSKWKCAWMNQSQDTKCISPFYTQRKVKVGFVIGRVSDTELKRLDTFAQQIGFEYELIGNRGYGNYVLKIAQGVTDVGAHPMTITVARHKIIDISSVHVFSEMVWVSLLPKRVPDNDGFKIVKVFHWEVWATILMTMVTIIIMLGPSFRSFVISLNALISEPFDGKWMQLDKPQIFILAFWLPMGFILNLSYRANLLVNILAIDYETPLDYSEQVLASNLPVWVYKTGLYNELFTNNPTEVLKGIYEKNVMQLGGTFEAQPGIPVPAHIQEMRDSGQSVWLDLMTFLKKTDHLYHKSKEVVKQSFRTFPLRQKSPLGEKFSLLMLRYNECQLDHFEEEEETGWKADLKAYLPKVAEEKTALRTDQVIPDLIILACGLGLAILVFLCETYVLAGNPSKCIKNCLSKKK